MNLFNRAKRRHDALMAGRGAQFYSLAEDVQRDLLPKSLNQYYETSRKNSRVTYAAESEPYFVPSGYDESLTVLRFHGSYSRWGNMPLIGRNNDSKVTIPPLENVGVDIGASSGREDLIDKNAGHVETVASFRLHDDFSLFSTDDYTIIKIAVMAARAVACGEKPPTHEELQQLTEVRIGVAYRRFATAAQAISLIESAAREQEERVRRESELQPSSEPGWPVLPSATTSTQHRRKPVVEDPDIAVNNRIIADAASMQTNARSTD